MKQGNKFFDDERTSGVQFLFLTRAEEDALAAQFGEPEVEPGEVCPALQSFGFTRQYYAGPGRPFTGPVLAHRTEGHTLFTQRFGWDI